MLNNFKTDNSQLFTIVAELFFTCKFFDFSNYEYRAGCPKSVGYLDLL